MSPFKTLKNCGNSSNEVLRIKRPTFVILGSSFILKMKRSVRPFSSASFFFNSSALVTMERNLYMVNGLPCKPIRFCEKKIGPPSSSLMASAVPNISGEKISSAKAEPTISSRRLITYVVFVYCGKLANNTGCSAVLRKYRR